MLYPSKLQLSVLPRSPPPSYLYNPGDSSAALQSAFSPMPGRNCRRQKEKRTNAEDKDKKPAIARSAHLRTAPTNHDTTALDPFAWPSSHDARQGAPSKQTHGRI
ncbi:hypothetical protein VIN7_6304 [Saccharomyces cerevisiae x Saccharomyces kudriavzevii VIN7]|uniref:Uncharacterized protein n=1 Tax=Saccharomyces cerevisiae x Saccharomyces kudriavzevii (strain VIN7) TaxID=1095631 RepID=H0GSX6_SACCK|nr:hypothetical protein VIN7_6304 [Saccharomyces cerevisiae x Saccharomyces kudriavzevii VIN7]